MLACPQPISLAPFHECNPDARDIVAAHIRKARPGVGRLANVADHELQPRQPLSDRSQTTVLAEPHVGRLAYLPHLAVRFLLDEALQGDHLVFPARATILSPALRALQTQMPAMHLAAYLPHIGSSWMSVEIGTSTRLERPLPRMTGTIE